MYASPAVVSIYSSGFATLAKEAPKTENARNQALFFRMIKKNCKNTIIGRPPAYPARMRTLSRSSRIFVLFFSEREDLCSSIFKTFPLDGHKIVIDGKPPPYNIKQAFRNPPSLTKHAHATRNQRLWPHWSSCLPCRCRQSRRRGRCCERPLPQH